MALSRKHVPGLYKKVLIFFMVFPVLTIFDIMSVPAASTTSESNIKSRDKIFAVHFLDAHHGCVVGDKGLILYTENGGNTWDRREQPMHYPLYDIAFFGDHGWIVGGAGTILYSCDGGNTWKPQDSGSTAALMSVAALNAQQVVATGEGGIILETADGGETWSSNAFDMFSALPEKLIDRGVISPNLYDVYFVETGHGWIVGDNGIVLHSSNAGADWHMLRIGILSSLYSVSFRDDNHGWAVGQNGLMLHSTDGGTTWERIELNTDQNLYKIYLREGAGIVVGENGTAFRSVDSGKTWELAALSLQPPFPWFTDTCILAPPSTHWTALCVGERSIESFIFPATEKD